MHSRNYAASLVPTIKWDSRSSTHTPQHTHTKIKVKVLELDLCLNLLPWVWAAICLVYLICFFQSCLALNINGRKKKIHLNFGQIISDLMDHLFVNLHLCCKNMARMLHKSSSSRQALFNMKNDTHTWPWREKMEILFSLGDHQIK